MNPNEPDMAAKSEHSEVESEQLAVTAAAPLQSEELSEAELAEVSGGPWVSVERKSYLSSAI